MAEIKLTQGKVAIVDDADLEWLSQWNWCVSKAGNGYCWYAVRGIRVDGKHRIVKMHRQILDAKPGQGVDHRDGNGLNNQRANLRLATTAQNNANAPKRRGYGGKPCISKFKGVGKSRSRSNPWRAYITVAGRHIPLGSFPTQEMAAAAYDAAAILHFGVFANLNFPRPTNEAEAVG